jgi:hypothetical protein
VGDPNFDLYTTCPSSTGLMNQRDQAIVVLDDLLGLDAKVVEALEPRTQERLERVSTVVDSSLRGRHILLPFDIRVQ